MSGESTLARGLGSESKLLPTAIGRVAIDRLLQFNPETGGALMRGSSAWLHSTRELRHGVKVDVFRFDKSQFPLHAAGRLQASCLLLLLLVHCCTTIVCLRW